MHTICTHARKAERKASEPHFTHITVVKIKLSTSAAAQGNPRLRGGSPAIWGGLNGPPRKRRTALASSSHWVRRTTCVIKCELRNIMRAELKVASLNGIEVEIWGKSWRLHSESTNGKAYTIKKSVQVVQMYVCKCCKAVRPIATELGEGKDCCRRVNCMTIATDTKLEE